MPAGGSSGSNEGFERRFGRGGGAPSGGAEGEGALTMVSGSLSRLTVGNPSSPARERFNAGCGLSALAKSGSIALVSPGGRAEGGRDTALESRRGLGGGASLRGGESLGVT